MSKTFANIKQQFGMVLIKGELHFGVHLQGTITEKGKSGFSILSADIDDNDDIGINTVLYAQANGELKEVDTTDVWYFNKKSEVQLNTIISDKVRKMVLKDINSMKACLSDFHSPLSSLSEADVEVALEVMTEKGILKDLEDFSEQLYKELAAEKKASSNVGLEAFIERYAFKEHILLAGPAGGGKTYIADKWLKDKKCNIEFLAGHAGVESTDLLGYSIRHTDGNFVWMDGPLTAAFRKAQTEEVGLMIDELLRIPTKELNILIGALTPNSTGEFVLRTNRIIDIASGIGKSETLVVPTKNLWVVATTNIGADYDVEDMDRALNDRFITHDVISSDSAVLNILNSTNVNALPDHVIQGLFKLFKAINSLVRAQELTHSMNVRHLTKILRNVLEHDEIKSYLFDLAPNVCSRTVEGTLNAVELKIYKETIKGLF